jgi:hypothetical protein
MQISFSEFNSLEEIHSHGNEVILNVELEPQNFYYND